MPEVVQDEAVVEAGPVKAVNGGSCIDSSQDKVKENGASSVETKAAAKNGHSNDHTENSEAEPAETAKSETNDNSEAETNGVTPTIEAETADKIPTAEAETTSDIPATEAETTSDIPATEAETTSKIPATEAETTSKIPATEAETTSKIPATEAESTGKIPATEAESTGKIPDTEADPTSKIPATKAETTDKIPDTEVETTSEIAATEATKETDRVESGAESKTSEETKPDSDTAASLTESKVEGIEAESTEQTPSTETETVGAASVDGVDSSEAVTVAKPVEKEVTGDKVDSTDEVTPVDNHKDKSMDTEEEEEKKEVTGPDSSDSGVCDKTKQNTVENEGVTSSGDGGSVTKEESSAQGVDSSVDSKEASKEVTAGDSSDSEKKIPEEIDTLITEGRACMAKNNFHGAADLLGQACEKLRESFGELDERCGHCYYFYGSAMLECAKTENSVLGEGVNKEESESEEEEEIPVVKEKDGEGVEGEKDKEGEEAQEEKMEEGKEVAEEGSQSPDQEEQMETEEKEDQVEESTDVTLNKEEEEEEDTTLKAAWETLELAKFIFEKRNDTKMLADTFMKLGEVAVESGHKEGVEDMRRCLDLRRQFYGEHHRAVAETHFNIGLSFSLFEMFDEAIAEFQASKDLLDKRIAALEGSDGKEEAQEIKSLLPDIDDKIRDMKESKDEKAKAELTLKKTEGESSSSGTPAPTTTSSKQTVPEKKEAVSNLTHLIKRKRKIEDVAESLPEKEPKQPCVEDKQ